MKKIGWIIVVITVLYSGLQGAENTRKVLVVCDMTGIFRDAYYADTLDLPTFSVLLRPQDTLEAFPLIFEGKRWTDFLTFAIIREDKKCEYAEFRKLGELSGSMIRKARIDTLRQVTIKGEGAYAYYEVGNKEAPVLPPGVYHITVSLRAHDIKNMHIVGDTCCSCQFQLRKIENRADTAVFLAHLGTNKLWGKLWGEYKVIPITPEMNREGERLLSEALQLTPSEIYWHIELLTLALREKDSQRAEQYRNGMLKAMSELPPNEKDKWENVVFRELHVFCLNALMEKDYEKAEICRSEMVKVTHIQP